jgi:PAS domain S-box-containing protein
MKVLLRLFDWPLRAKMAALLAVASFLPLAIAALLDVRDARKARLGATKALLSARGDHVRELIDGFHRVYRVSVDRFARLPLVVQYGRSHATDADRMHAVMQGVFAAHVGTDDAVRGGALLDASGGVLFATDESLVVSDATRRADVRQAWRGLTVVSDMHVAGSAGSEEPIISYYAPVLGGDGRAVAVVALWVRAAGLWRIMRASNALAGKGSFAVLFDQYGIRVAHTYSDDLVFRPAGRLEQAAVARLMAERRFGARTRQLLADVRPFPEQFDLARSVSPDGELFRGVVPLDRTWAYGVARRLEMVPWTLFYMVPEQNIDAAIAAITRRKIIFAGAITLLALLVGAVVAAGILESIRSVSKATASLASGDLSARISPRNRDELAQLATSFNAMAERIEAQAAAVALHRDELERRVAERTAQLEAANHEMRDSQTRYRTLAESLPNLVWTCLPDGYCDYLSRQWVEYTGVPEDAQVGSAWIQQVHPDDRPRVQAAWAEATSHGGPYEVEFRIRRADGVYRWFQTRAVPVRDSTGAIVKWFGSNTDVEDSKQAENKLAAQLERLALLDRITRAIGERQDLASIFQVVVGSIEDHMPVDFSCLCVHESGQDWLSVSGVGCKSEQLAADMAIPGRVPIDENGMARCMRGELVYEADIGGSPFWFPLRLVAAGLRSLVIAPLSIESKVFGVLVAARREPGSFSSGDCEFLGQVGQHTALAAHQAQLYEALQGAYDDLRQSQQAVMQQERLRALGQMASGIAHDINNAVSPISLYTESLLESEPSLSARARAYLEVIQRAIDDVGQTVSRMREFYRQQGPGLELAPVCLNRLVRQVLDLSRARWNDIAQQAGVAIDVATELADELPPVMGAEGEIRDALLNLVFNAIDAMPRGGRLLLVTRSMAGAQGPAVCIEVVDSGVGMDEETRRHCTEPFFTTKGERGTGLGLAMVYGVASRHNAELAIESQKGRGTTVRLTFAAAAPEPRAQSAAATPIPPRLRILVVDDDPILLRSLRDSLESDGHLVVSASDGQAGIEAFHAAEARGESFGVVITDLGMPHVDGRRVAATIKLASPTTPVILLTGWGHRLAAERDVPAHVDHVLSKPPKLVQLREALARFAPSAPSGGPVA